MAATAAPAVASTVGLKKMVIALVTKDDDSGTTYGELQKVAGAIEASITPENNDPDIQYYDDIEGDVLYPDPELAFKTKLADLPLVGDDSQAEVSLSWNACFAIVPSKCIVPCNKCTRCSRTDGHAARALGFFITMDGQ